MNNEQIQKEIKNLWFEVSCILVILSIAIIVLSFDKRRVCNCIQQSAPAVIQQVEDGGGLQLPPSQITEN